MKAVRELLSKDSDFLIFDYRGNGQSGGRFGFGTHEVEDCLSVLRWARPKYKKIRLLGFSLGAYSALRAASEHPELVDELYLASCPRSMEAIVLSGAPILNLLCMPFQQPHSKVGAKGNALGFRWGALFGRKPDGVALARELKVPVKFLAGGRDMLVYQSQSRKIFEAVPANKSWDLWEDGLHAEAMLLEFPERFTAWLTSPLAPSN
jgi:pimeloyl-ACP methyl ester carboxylesterase